MKSIISCGGGFIETAVLLRQQLLSLTRSKKGFVKKLKSSVFSTILQIKHSAYVVVPNFSSVLLL